MFVFSPSQNLIDHNQSKSMKNNYCVWVILCSIILTACGPDKRIALAEKLMVEGEADSAMTIMQSIRQPLYQLSDHDYALYALLMSEAVHRKGELNAATDTLLLPAISYFSQSGDSSLAARALYCKGHLERQLYRMNDALRSFQKALLFLQGSNNYEQLYKVNTWLGVVSQVQDEYPSKVQYSRAALEAAKKLGNNFYKNLALCDIANGYYFMAQPDSALHYANTAYAAAIADSLPEQLTNIYSNLGLIYGEKGEYNKALDYVNKAIEFRPSDDSINIMTLYTKKVALFGFLQQYDSARYYYEKSIVSPYLLARADAYQFMSRIYSQMGRHPEAYSYLSHHIEAMDSIRKQQYKEETIALQEFYQHEQLSIENLHWRNQVIKKENNVYYMIIVSLLLLLIASTIYIIYQRRLRMQKKQLMIQQEELYLQQRKHTENQQRITEMRQKEIKLKETFFRGLSQHIVGDIEKGKNIVLTDDNWKRIMQDADTIFDGFTSHLQQKYPSLNKEDLCYCCMVKMQLSQLEMSRIMHLEKDSVKKRLKRIRVEKMGADSGITLEELLRQV